MKIVKALSEELQKRLPGDEFHYTMLPAGRPRPVISGVESKNAAVALLICEDKSRSTFELILIKRTEYNGHHSGQVSFPGGKTDRSDLNLMQTALRETYEETGIKIQPQQFLGALTPLYIQVSNFLVYPYVFYLSSIPEFSPEPKEVQYIILFELRKLLDDQLCQHTTMTVGNEEIEVPFYAISGETVWGATAMILAEFIEILKRISEKNPGLF
jgi:8-oxo-dGTP pyrophosphatase MutT (NUDIX family)